MTITEDRTLRRLSCLSLSLVGSIACSVGAEGPGASAGPLGLAEQQLIDPTPGGHGLRRVAIIMVYFGTPDELTPAMMRETVFGSPTSTHALFQEMSFGQVGLEGDVYGWFQIDPPADANVQPIADQAEARVSAMGVDLSGYDHVAFYFPYTDRVSPGGQAHQGETPSTPARYSWFNGWYPWRQSSLFAHEWLHNLGLDHAGALDCGDAAVAPATSCVHALVSDTLDPMGIGLGQLSAYSKAQLGWLEPCNVVATPASGSFELAPMEVASSKIHTLRVPANPALCPWDYEDGCYYYLEYRQPLGLMDTDARYEDSPLFSGAIVRLGTAIDPTGATRARPAVMLDATPTTDYAGSAFGDAQLDVGATWVDPYGTELRVVAQTPEALSVRINVPGGVGPATCSDGSLYDPGSSTALQATLRVLSDWESGFCGDLTVVNPGTTPVSGWGVVARFAASEFMTTWNASYTAGDAGTVEIRPLSYNEIIYPASSVNSGFCATKLGPAYAPEVIRVTSGG